MYAGNKLKAVLKGNGGDHRIRRADGSACAFQFARYTTC